jgi:hypothetical protein
LNADLASVEEQLRGLRPPAADLDRDRVMFRAGRASTPRGWGWVAAAGSTLLAAVFGALLLFRPEPQSTVRIVYIREPAPAPEPPSSHEQPPDRDQPAPAWLTPSRYHGVEERILRGTPGPRAAPDREPAPRESYWTLLRSL